MSVRNLADPRPGRKLPQVILVTDAGRLPDPRAAIENLPAQSAVIVRHYQIPQREGLVRTIIALCRPRAIRVFVAGDAALARSAGADGLHLPEAMLFDNPENWRNKLHPEQYLSAAAHSLRALQRAGRVGADFALLSPVFPTRSHPDAPALGIPRFSRMVGQSPLPVYGLGGITAENAGRVLAAGAVGWASLGGLSS